MANCGVPVDCSYINAFVTWNQNTSASQPPLLPQSLADPDISGIGVMTAFLATAYITWTVVAIGYCAGFLDESLLGVLDQRLFKVKHRHSKRWRLLLEKVVLMLSDQQILTGLAILIAGYAKACTINIYHWNVVVYLAWMSSGTHLITLSVLRFYLRGKSRLRTLRVSGMFVLFVLLFVALMPTGSIQWSAFLQQDEVYPDISTTGVQAACFWQTSYWYGWKWDGALTYILLITNYVTRAGALFEANEARFRGYFHDRPLKFLETPLTRVASRMRQRNAQRRKVGYFLRMSYHTLLFVYCIILALLDLYGSFFGPLFWVLLNLIWGTIQMLTPRNILPATTVAGENSFGFGQIVPLLLLALPLVAVSEAYYEAEEQSGSTSRAPSAAPQQQAQHSSEAVELQHLTNVSRPGSIERLNATLPEQRADSSSLHLTAERTNVDEEQPVCNLETPQGTSERLGPPSSIALSLITSESQLELPNGSSAMWKAHQQDFYASKWFKSLHVFIISFILMLACFVFTFLALGSDVIDSIALLTPVIFSLFIGAILFLPIGIFGSRVFR